MKAKKYIEKILETNNASKEEELIHVLSKALKTLKVHDEEEYEDISCKLYEILYGEVLNDELCEYWVSCMINKDGTVGEHWSVEDTNQVAKQLGIKLDTVTPYEWYATMNMVYSDYYGSVPNEISTYAKIANDFLQDEDAKKGKLYRYYKCIVK